MQSLWRSPTVRRLKLLRHLSHNVRVERNYNVCANPPVLPNQILANQHNEPW